MSVDWTKIITKKAGVAAICVWALTVIVLPLNAWLAFGLGMSYMLLDFLNQRPGGKAKREITVKPTGGLND